ncbi:MAG: cupin domain-containing protein [Lachnospiraceae bacterium]|jgi:mannose-6-phosphate isomerase-like protein (cupin superfamily)
MKIISRQKAKVSLDGCEVVRDYCRTDKIWFGTSELLPGQTGGIDPGHPISHEFFFVSCGQVIVRNPQTDCCYELNEGDLLLIEEGEPHEITNIGMTKALVAWCGGPVD